MCSQTTCSKITKWVPSILISQIAKSNNDFFSIILSLINFRTALIKLSLFMCSFELSVFFSFFPTGPGLSGRWTVMSFVILSFISIYNTISFLLFFGFSAVSGLCHNESQNTINTMCLLNWVGFLVVSLCVSLGKLWSNDNMDTGCVMLRVFFMK